VLYKQLRILNLSNNFISDFDALKPLGRSTADTLVKVDLSANPVVELHGYREYVFELLPAVEVLDGCDRLGEQVYEDIYGADEDLA
jgi:hypothetical protein